MQRICRQRCYVLGGERDTLVRYGKHMCAYIYIFSKHTLLYIWIYIFKTFSDVQLLLVFILRDTLIYLVLYIERKSRFSVVCVRLQRLLYVTSVRGALCGY